MKTITYDIIIDHISSVAGSHVTADFHREGGNLGRGVRDGFESRRIGVDELAGGIPAQVEAALGTSETVEIEDEAATINKAVTPLPQSVPCLNCNPLPHVKKMKILEGSTIEEAAANLQRLRGWSPYRFSGTWHLIHTPEGVAYVRTKEAAERICQRYSLTSYSTVKV